MKKIWSIVTVAIGVCPLLVNAKLGERNGFSGEIAINAAYSSSTSNLTNTDDEFKVYRQGEDQQSSSALVLPLGNVQYTFGSTSNQQLFLGTSRTDIAVGTLALEAGYKYRFEHGTKLSFSILPTILEAEIWQDPYSLSARETTNEKGMAYRLQLNNIAGSLFSVDLAYGKRDIDDERSGAALVDGSILNEQQSRMLDRNADILYSKFKMMLPISRQVLLYPSLIYTKQDAKGSAMTSNAYGAEISSFVSAGNHQFALTFSYLNRKYAEGNPVFDNVTQQDDTWKAFIAYEYPGVFSVEQLSLVSFAGYNSSQSNIEFYNSNSWITALGLNWTF